jgi:predicted PurR-regulated permease PerM
MSTSRVARPGAEDETAPHLVGPAASDLSGEPFAVVDTTEAQPEIQEEALPSDAKTVFLAGLFLLAMLAVCYAAADFILPIVVAFVLMLVLQPVMRLLEKLRVPRGVGAALLILVLFCALAGIVSMLSGPAGDWIQKLPEGIPKLQERLSFLSRPIAGFEDFVRRAQSLTHMSGPSPLPVTLEGSALGDRLLYGTRYVVSGLLQTVLVLFFLLVTGDRFLRRLVEVLPRFRNKRQAVQISQQIERDISAYLATITIMNIGVGVATGAVVALCGLGDPLLWGTLAFLLNYIPILGPLLGIVVFLLAGLLAIDALWLAVLPAGLYLVIHLLEGEVITPLLVARRFTINPVLVIIGLVFWYWMWGIPGAILATPMLATTKIICDRIQSLSAFGHLIEG